ncbi:aminoglycoside phosphotransferase [Halobacteriales archaeon SW_7_65_23]|nr:MAG: aminoglycoside phosphotransferase [Halobacteriales archaeon SW_7_65_23]
MSSSPPPRHVGRIVDAALGSGIRSCERATGGRMAETYLLGLDGDPARAVCKLGGPSVRTGDVVEPPVLRLVTATTDLPAPAVFASGTLRRERASEAAARDARPASDYWGLYEFRDGDPPTPFDALDADVRQGIVRETGAFLAQLHAAHQFERTGGLGRTDGNLQICEHAGLNAPDLARRLAERRSGADPVDRQPVLTHGDLFPGNLLVADGKITAVLDWGNAHVTTAGYALARAEMRFVDWFRFPSGERRALRTALRKGYRQYREIPADYERHASAYKLLWLLQSADRIRRHLQSKRGRRQLQRHVRSLLPDVVR